MSVVDLTAEGDGGATSREADTVEEIVVLAFDVRSRTDVIMHNIHVVKRQTASGRWCYRLVGTNDTGHPLSRLIKTEDAPQYEAKFGSATIG